MKNAVKIFGFCLVPFLGGCTIIGFLLSPSSSEQKIRAQFPLSEHNEEVLYLVVRGTQASGVDVDVPHLLATAVVKDLRRNVTMKEENIINELETDQHASFAYFSWSQVEENARRAGAKLLLYVEIIEYELVPVHQENYMGQLTTRSALMDTSTGEVLWPMDKRGRIVKTAVEFEKNGRSETLWRLVTATSHCIVREFYNCPKPAYLVSEEVKSLDTIMEDLY